MGIKHPGGTLDDPCLDKIAPGEPFFILRGQDVLAPNLIRIWMAEMSARHVRAGTMTNAILNKLMEASATVDAMDAWPTRKLPD